MSKKGLGAVPKTTRPTRPALLLSKTQRTPPRQTPDDSTFRSSTNDSIYQCEICSVTDNVPKVCCDDCGLWFHFVCEIVPIDVAKQDHWYCRKCRNKGQETLISIEDAVTQSVVTSAQSKISNVQAISTSVVVSTSQAAVVTTISGNNRQSSSRSHKSKSAKSNTSTASKRKTLALQRLEEEQALQKVREQEEKARREEERRIRELKDKEYLDKKYSILEENSDDSLSYDDYDEILVANREEQTKAWVEVRNNGAHGMPIEKETQAIPLLSSTNFFPQYTNKLDEPIMKPQVAPNLASIDNPVHSQTTTSKFTIDGPATQQNVVSIPRKTTSKVQMIDAINQPYRIELNDKGHLHSVFKQMSSPQEQAIIDITRQPYHIEIDDTNPVGYIIKSSNTQDLNHQSNLHSQPLNYQQTMQPVVTNNQQVITVQQNQPPVTIHQSTDNTASGSNAAISVSLVNQQPIYVAQAQAGTSGNQPVLKEFETFFQRQARLHQENNTNSSTSNVVNNATHPSHSTIDSTFAVSQPIRSSITSTKIVPSSYNFDGYSQAAQYNHQHETLSQTPSNYHTTIPQSQQTLTTQSVLVSNSMPQIGLQNPTTSSTNYQSTFNVQPNSSMGPQYNFSNSNTQFGTSMATSAPVVLGQQSNSNAASNTTMNIPNPFSSTPSNQISINASVMGQLTKEQIAARHAVPKDLPKFYGNSEDWYKFISAYENSTALCGYNNYENLGRLQKCLDGDAYDVVESLLIHAQAVPEVIRILTMLYGKPEQIIEVKIKEIQNEPAPKENDLASIMRFAIKVRNLSGTIQNTGALEHLRNPMLINTITDKLPTQMQLSWACHKQSVGYTDLAVLGDWLHRIAEAASFVVRTSIKNTSKKKEQSKDNNSKSSSAKSGNYVNTQVDSSTKASRNTTTEVKKCPACKNSSCTKIYNCHKFKEISRSDRSSIVKDNKLCTRCLGGHHFYRCRSNFTCKIEGCNAKHHTLLHNHEKPTDTPPKTNDSQANVTKVSVNKFSSNASHTNVAPTNRNDRVDIFRIVPIKVSHKNRIIETYAYLDDGSNMTTMEADLANELNLRGTSAPICVDWAFGYTHSVESKIVSVQISGCFTGAEQFNLDNVRTVKELHLPTQSISQYWIEQYKHLKGLPISTYDEVKPRMLIGLQYSRLTVSLKTVEGNEYEPLACHTRLGWVVQGPSYNTSNQLKRQYSMNMCECQSHDIKLHQLVKEYFSSENLGVKVADTLLESKEIQRAKQILESTTSKKDGRYETGLLWKQDSFELPNSYHMAVKRLQCLEAKMAKNPTLAENLRNQMYQFVDKGYVRKLNPDEIKVTDGSPVWYLPTFPAFNPKKPEKVRIVWDGAAKVLNISLNSMLLTGPDQLVPLPDILRRFRERLYAIIGDIREMFHQIKVINSDQNVQRFLWRDGDSSRQPDVYVMLVVTFGLTCSPSQAQFIKNKNAMEFIDVYPEAANTIINNHYVDDMLDCEHTIDDAVKRIKEVKLIHKSGGFEIRNFLSNSKELLQRIGENTDEQDKNMNISVELATERVLGMFWNTATDCFTFSLKFTKINENILSGKQCPTKREVLRILMSVFDPLGLLANYLIYTKILLQEIWRSNIDWDEEVPSLIFKKWLVWIKTLPQVENIQIPRLYSTKLSPNTPKSIQLHTFVDASAEAYATAIYLRIEDNEGVDCCLVGAKTKVAPNKPMSIPRLELQGAVLGTRLANNIKSSQTITFEKQVYWTDSQTVMGWINSEARKYNQFVAFRIGEVLEASNQVDWRWIPSEHNVADEATKSKDIAKLNSRSRWYEAPGFLYEKEETWFNDKGEVEYFTEEEMKPSYTMACREVIRPKLIEIERFSQWNRLLRATAFAFRFIYNIRRKRPQRQYGPLSQQELRDAENHLYQRAQSDCFLDEIIIMKHNRNASLQQRKEFDPSSVLRTSSPYIDEHDVIRIKGRTDAAPALSFDAKRPIILPRRHYITKLVVDLYHRRYKHINHATALNEIRQKYSIPALRVVMKGVRASCQKCKNLNAVPKIPEMAELPPARLATHTRPFTYVGLDYFGPMRVRNGRKTRNRPVIMEKRWILLFTCLTTRAVRMEISHSLDTDSCIMSVENFMNRNGQPQEIHSDNGSSFHSSEKELSAEFEKLDKAKIEEKFTSAETIWKFNPPATPHMGGIWERLVRTVKSCLKQTMLTRTPNDEMLKNLIITAENIVNSRPLTYVSLESAEDEALTPNHILLGSSNGRKPLGNIVDKDLARNTHKAVQVLANNFWRRFVLEYMPTLTKRTKWFKPVEPIKIGDVVIIVDERNERNTWSKGIVDELLPAKHGIVRQVMVRTAKGIRRRSVGKLAVLDVKQPTDEVKQDQDVPVNGEGNVGKRVISCQH